MTLRVLPAAFLVILLPCLPAARAGQPALGADDEALYGDGDAATYEELIAAPPALPSSLEPRDLYAALTPSQRATIDLDERVVTFAHRATRSGGQTELVAWSVGTLRHPSTTVRTLLAAVQDYPAWLTLHPSYKSARVEGRARLVVGVGSADAPKAKRTMVYEVAPTQAGARWTVLESGAQLERGSLVEVQVAPHPTIDGAALVVHRQVGLLPDGRMLKYLSGDDKKGRNRWWADCYRHARRLHWALDAAVRSGSRSEREKTYLGHFQREFHGELPYWVTR